LSKHNSFFPSRIQIFIAVLQLACKSEGTKVNYYILASRLEQKGQLLEHNLHTVKLCPMLLCWVRLWNSKNDC